MLLLLLFFSQQLKYIARLGDFGEVKLGPDFASGSSVPRRRA
jgi:hypothetical protein